MSPLCTERMALTSGVSAALQKHTSGQFLGCRQQMIGNTLNLDLRTALRCDFFCKQPRMAQREALPLVRTRTGPSAL